MGIKHTFTNKEKPTFELIPNGIYPAEVRKFDTGLSNGPKTSGSDQMELMFTIFKDESFTEKIGSQRDTIIFHESCDWRADAFAVSFNIAPSKPGEGIEFEESLCVGARGWVAVKVEDYKDKTTGEPKKSNKINDYPTDRKRFPKYVEPKSEWEDPGE